MSGLLIISRSQLNLLINANSIAVNNSFIRCVRQDNRGVNYEIYYKHETNIILSEQRCLLWVFRGNFSCAGIIRILLTGYDVELNADNPAGGICFYNLTSGSFTKTKEWFY